MTQWIDVPFTELVDCVEQELRHIMTDRQYVSWLPPRHLALLCDESCQNMTRITG